MSHALNQLLANTAPVLAVDVDDEVAAAVSQLIVCPVKSYAGVQLKQALLTETGLQWNRAWRVVDANGDFLTQRELPRMALVQPQLRHSEMVLRAPGMARFRLNIVLGSPAGGAALLPHDEDRLALLRIATPQGRV